MTDDPWLSIKDGAALCGKSTKTIRRLIADGSLPAYRLGTKSILIKRSDLDALIRPIPAAR